MVFCGHSFCGGAQSLDHTPTSVKNIQVLTIRNGIYDELYVTRDTSYPYSISIPKTWDFDTIMHAHFNGNLHAGNVEYSLDEVSHIRIKRRETGTFNWITLFEVPVTDYDDMRFQLYDKYNRAKVKYDYAMVPVTNNVEGNLNINSVYSDFDGVFLVEKGQTYNTALNVDIQSQKNHPTEAINTLGRQYPFIVSNSQNNYYSGTTTATFIEYNPAIRDWNVDSGWKYRRGLMEFMQNGRPKIMKYYDGRMWLINIMDASTEQAPDHIDAPTTSFNWTEVGDVESVQDLYFNGLIDINPEWWVVRG